MIDTSTVRTENILSALKANFGGSLPPSKADMIHTIELLLAEGVRQRDIVEKFPIPASMTRSMIHTITKTAYNRKIGYAVDKVIQDGFTVAKAAEQFGIDADDLKTTISKRKKRSHGTSDIIKALEFRTRGYSQFLSKQANSIRNGIDDGRYTVGELDVFMGKATRAVKSINRTMERFRERVEAGPSLTNDEE